MTAALGSINGCSKVSLPSTGFPFWPLPAMVRIIPELRSTARIRRFRISAMSSVFSSGVRLMEMGVSSFAFSASPLSPEKPFWFGVPARVDSRLLLPLILRTKLLWVSDMYRKLFEAHARLCMLLYIPLSAESPSPAYPFFPLPDKV